MKKVYILQKFKLMDFHELELFGDQLYCGVPVEEQAEADERFWSTIGDYETMGRAEYQRLYRKLGNYQSEQETGNVMIRCFLLHRARLCLTGRMKGAVIVTAFGEIRHREKLIICICWR